VRWLPLIILAAFVLGMLIMAYRARRRAAAAHERMRSEITIGAQVMTTSGLYGTVVALNPDDTAILAIAPGVEVRWAVAALRDADALPARYRRSVATGATSADNARVGSRLDSADESA
jgi:preprotein translocase subunit YajC